MTVEIIFGISNLTFLFFFSFISYYIFVSYGLLFVNKKFYYKNDESLLFIIGIIALNIASFLLYILNFKFYLNFIIFLFGTYLLYKNLSFFRKTLKKNFIIFISIFSLLIISKTHEDFYDYHLKFIDQVTNFNFALGLGNLHFNFIYSSFFAYFQKNFFLPIIEYKIIFVPVFLLYFSFINFLFSNIKKNNYYSHFFIFILFVSLLKFNNLKSFGYDFISHIILLYFLLYFFISIKKKINVYFLSTLILYSILIKATSLFYIFIFLGILAFLYIRRKKIYFEKNEKKFSIILISLILIFFCSSIINSGCITYFLDFTCNKKIFSWSINTDQINNFSKHVELTAKGYYHQNTDDRIINPSDYILNFNWINNWIKIHFFYRIFEFIIIIILCLILVMFCLRPKLLFQKNKFLGSILFVASIGSIIFWFTKYPDIRFGISTFIAFFISIFLFFKINYNFNLSIKKKINIFTIILLLFFNAKNIQRIYSEFKRTDRYEFTDFPYPPINKGLYKTENLIYSKTVNHMIENQKFTNLFWINIITNK
jgi:hypothetical protein